LLLVLLADPLVAEAVGAIDLLMALLVAVAEAAGAEIYSETSLSLLVIIKLAPHYMAWEPH
jgi:hypothetical protein